MGVSLLTFDLWIQTHISPHCLVMAWRRFQQASYLFSLSTAIQNLHFVIFNFITAIIHLQRESGNHLVFFWPTAKRFTILQLQQYLGNPKGNLFTQSWLFSEHKIFDGIHPMLVRIWTRVPSRWFQWIPTEFAKLSLKKSKYPNL